MQIQILNSFSGDDKSEIDTSTEDGRSSVKKLVDELLRSRSAVFLEKEINGTQHTYRVTGYDPTNDKLTIRLDSNTALDAGVELPKKHGRKGPRSPYRKSSGAIDAGTGRVVSVAPRSGG